MRPEVDSSLKVITNLRFWQVGAALTNKVSRERMGTELDKMFTGHLNLRI